MSIIRTKYLGPTNHNGSRIRATLHTASATVPYDSALSSADNHQAAAMKLARKLNLQGQWARIWDQSQSNGNTYICMTDAHSEFVVGPEA